MRAITVLRTSGSRWSLYLITVSHVVSYRGCMNCVGQVHDGQGRAGMGEAAVRVHASSRGGCARSYGPGEAQQLADAQERPVDRFGVGELEPCRPCAAA